jgi:dipeptidyl aminopeptidase/acylaminoacyl peptidase
MQPTSRPSAAFRVLLAALVLGLFPLAPLSARQSAGAGGAGADRPIAQLELEARYVQPPAPVAEMFRRDPNFATLDAPAPGGRWFLVPLATELSTLDLMSRPTLRLAELEIRPRTDRLWHLDTYGITGLRIFDMEARRFRDVALPAGTFVSDMVWSPDGARLAFLAHLPAGTEVWTADPATGRASRLSDARVLATLGTSAQTGVRTSRMLQWTAEGTVLTFAVPAGRGAEPARPQVPPGPMVRQSRPEATPTRTFPFLLRDAHDATLFEHYTRAQLVELAAGRRARPLGEARIYESIALSPDGRHVLATFVEPPFSLITSHQGFARRTVVLDRDGAVVSTLEARGLREGGGGRGGAGADAARRNIGWRPDGAGLAFLQRGPGGSDQLLLLPAPFDTAAAQVVAASADPIRSVAYSADGTRAFAAVTRSGRTALVHWELRAAEPERRTLVDFHHPDSLFTQPGDFWTMRTSNGIEHALVSTAGDAAYLRGNGYRPDYRPRPFVDRVALADGARTRLFEGAADTFDQPLVALDADLGRMIVSREGAYLFPDSHLWTRGAGLVNLTNNADPFPELTAARKVDFSFARRDGLEVRGRITLPLGYREGDKVPAIFWTYPREFTTAPAYTRSAIQARNHNAHTQLAWLRWSELWLTQGYALVSPDIPIIGENYNDTYISSLTDAMYGAMRAVDRLGFVDMDRIGHGGHSYGAFATANLLAHTPFFRAGIAGNGAYNRSLTPGGFQAESRDLWSAQQTYLDMSPFFKADQITAPLLMYHGADDNNTGTWPMQSERLMQALTSLGKEAVLYLYPFESHTPRAIETNLDMWARWIEWFDTHVKGRTGVATAAR